MTREEIIRLAREAGMTGLDSGGLLENFERFAELVVAAERSACAEICDRVAMRYGEGPELEHFQQGFGDGATICRNRIRARGKQE